MNMRAMGWIRFVRTSTIELWRNESSSGLCQLYNICINIVYENVSLNGTKCGKQITVKHS